MRSADPATDLAALARTARAVSSEIEAVFDDVPHRLFELQDRVEAVSGSLTDLSARCGLEGRTRLADQARRAGDRATGLRERLGRLAEVAGLMQDRSAEIRGLLTEIRRDARGTRVIATNALIVGSSIRAGDGSIQHFASGARETIEEVEQALERLAEALEDADDRMKDAGPKLEACSRDLARMDRLYVELPGLVGAVFDRTDLPRRAADLSATVTRLAQELGAALVGLQAGDALRQRLDHVAEIAELAPGTPAEDRPVLQALCRTLVATATESLREAEERVLPRFATMKEHAGRAAADLRELSEAVDAADLTAFADRLTAEAGGGSALAAPALREELLAAAKAYAAVAGPAATIARTEQTIHLMGLNATLVSTRYGQEGRAMMEVSRQLRDSRTELGDRSRALIDRTRRQEAAIADLEAIELGEEQGAADALKDLGESTRVLADLLARVAAARDLEVEAAVARASETFAGFSAGIRRRLAPWADKHAHVPGPMSPGLSARIRRLYSIADEREVHDRIAGRPPGADPETREEEEDVFFA
ncbi:coiled-coil domain-containing protein [Histidinibacterium aquaticum]|uniref:Methyl-accepting transducer domain-containing protein n=1 Tax=Histidinibacterium aquaticum TaxID=2613962 RepID=A0A5J5GKC6_9RHOB|nr:hypothetical protein [Histidinibacterium aquaticum]KAA9008004.1 hypothetical protein F3S47_10860 [Histidinibacterium aquaticum]